MEWARQASPPPSTQPPPLRFVGRFDGHFYVLDICLLADLRVLGACAGACAVGYVEAFDPGLFIYDERLQGTGTHDAQQVGGEGRVVSQYALELGCHHALEIAVATYVSLQRLGRAAAVVLALETMAHGIDKAFDLLFAFGIDIGAGVGDDGGGSCAAHEWAELVQSVDYQGSQGCRVHTHLPREYTE